MKVRCEVEAIVKLQQAFYIDVDDPTDDEKIDKVLYPAWEDRMYEMTDDLPYGDDWHMQKWMLVHKDVIEDE